MFLDIIDSKEQDRKFEGSCIEHMDNLYAAALKMTRNPSDAEELVQDTFVRAFRFKKKFEWGTNLKAWLFRILTNTFINNYRRKGHERKYVERAAVEPIYDEILDKEARAYASNPESHIFSSFFKKELDEALNDLPEDFRIVVVLSDLQDFSYKEISEILDCPIGTVMSRLHRGRKILQRNLVDYAVAAGIIKDTAGNTVEKNAVTKNAVTKNEATKIETTDINEYRMKRGGTQ